jgi:hypothetical protein
MFLVRDLRIWPVKTASRQLGAEMALKISVILKEDPIVFSSVRNSTSVVVVGTEEPKRSAAARSAMAGAEA